MKNKNILLLIFMLLTRASTAQNLSFSQLMLCQKQNFNYTNNFFIGANWESEVIKESRKMDDSYTVGWGKVTNTEFGMIKIQYDNLKPDDNASYKPVNLNVVTYLFTDKANLLKIKDAVEHSGYKPEKPAFKDGHVYSTYTDGTYVVLIGNIKLDNINSYEVIIMHYAVYAVKYTDLLDK